MEPLERLSTLSARRRRRVQAVAATAAAVGRKVPNGHVGVSRCVHLLERKEFPRHLDAAIAELAIDLSQPGRGTMDIRACEIEVHVYGNGIAHERSFCAGHRDACASLAHWTRPYRSPRVVNRRRGRREITRIVDRGADLNALGNRVRRGRNPGSGACFVHPRSRHQTTQSRFGVSGDRTTARRHPRQDRTAPV